MRRRDFIAGARDAAAGAVAFTICLPFVTQARAQQGRERMRRIGVLTAFADGDGFGQSRMAAFVEALQRLGWIEGRNVRIAYRYAAGDLGRYRTFAKELVDLRPDALLAVGTPSAEALRKATRSLPIVFTGTADPIGAGLVASLARPGGNVTGFIPGEAPLAGKLLQLLKEVAPQVTRIAFLYNPEVTYARAYFGYAETAAGTYGVQLIAAPVRNDADIGRTLSALARDPNGGLLVLPDDVTTLYREQIVALAVRDRLPAVYDARIFVEAGGLISYARKDELEDYRGAAGYIDRILKGEKPADLPVQTPVRYELIVNLKAAKAIGLTIPETFLVRADQVIE